MTEDAPLVFFSTNMRSVWILYKNWLMSMLFWNQMCLEQNNWEQNFAWRYCLWKRGILTSHREGLAVICTLIIKQPQNKSDSVMANSDVLRDSKIGVGKMSTNCLFINNHFQDSLLLSHHTIRWNFNGLFQTVINVCIVFISDRILSLSFDRPRSYIASYSISKLPS